MVQKRQIIDIHTHAFPDAIAARAMAQLHSECDIQSYLDGRLCSLLGSMDEAGIEKSVLCSIATRPEQFDSILRWSMEIRSERIIPFPSVHPKDPQAVDRVNEIRKSGFLGVKIHPYYQDICIDDPALNLLYKSIVENNLILVLHTGYDVAFQNEERANPQQILTVLNRFPSLRLITTHMGGWFQWDQVEKFLLGKPIYMETSVSYEYLGPNRAKRILDNHNHDYLLFGTDSPWDDQKKAISDIDRLFSDENFKDKLFYTNARQLLGSGIKDDISGPC